MAKAQILSACRHFMAPVIRMLLRGGVTWKEFGELSKEVFVDVARRDYGIQGRPTNLARVSLITGMSRREVTRIRDVLAGQEEPKVAPGSRISHVLTGWYTDEEFKDGAGNPAVLPREGEAGSVASLLKRYAGDLPHGALLKELTQLGLVEDTGAGAYRVLSRHYTRSALDPDLIRQMGIAIHDHAATLAHNVNPERKKPALFEGIASNTQVASRHARRFADLVEEHGEAFLEQMDEWLSKHEVKGTPNPKNAPVRMGVGVYLIIEDSRRGQKK